MIYAVSYIILAMNYKDKKTKQIMGLIAFISGILLITLSNSIPLPDALIYVVGALLIAYGVMNITKLMDIIDNKDGRDNKEIVGLIGIMGTKGIIALISFIVGILLIASSVTIPLPVTIVNVVGALLIAYGVLNFISIIKI